jgi:hypothetical protein
MTSTKSVDNTVNISTDVDIDTGGCSFSSAIASLIQWIDEINKTVAAWADDASKLSVANQKYTQDQTDELNKAMTGDAWVEAWAKDKPADHPNYHPGINNIPPDNQYAATWQNAAQTYYQQIQYRTQANITSSSSIAQVAGDNSSDESKTTQAGYSIISQAVGVIGNLGHLQLV